MLSLGSLSTILFLLVIATSLVNEKCDARRLETTIEEHRETAPETSKPDQRKVELKIRKEEPKKQREVPSERKEPKQPDSPEEPETLAFIDYNSNANETKTDEKEKTGTVKEKDAKG